MYTYLHFFLRKHYKELRDAAGDPHAGGVNLTALSDSTDDRDERDKNDDSGAQTQKSSRQDPEYGEKVKKVLIMRAYPTFYVILLIPGILNRMVEAWGGSSKVLQLMQASTQFVGLANAITYGWNERILEQLKLKFGRKSKSSSGSRMV